MSKLKDGRKNRIIPDSAVVRRILGRCRLNTDSGCLEWQGYTDPQGYGQTTYKGKLTSVHRVMFMAHHGIVLPSDQYVCHRCDNPPCCNVQHHFVGDVLANTRDMATKGRHASQRGTWNLPRGERAHRAKITDAQEAEIRALLKMGVTPTAIHKMAKFPISRSGISKIKHGSSRKHNYV